LVISGANAGGKSVWLKTLGLCAALVRLGAPIPCRGEPTIGVFDPVFADVGDAQSAEGNVSTYVGHLRVAAAAVAEARSSATLTPLVLLDELGSGTDAAQGAALGRAVLEDLVDHGALVVCTTHARPLKALGLQEDDSRFRAAAMAPGFKCIEGRAGESDALEAARTKADFPPELLERAEVLLGDDERRLATLARDLDKARESAEAAEARAVEALASAREAEAKAEERFLAVEAEAKKKAALQAQDYEARVAALEKELQRDMRRGASDAFGSSKVIEEAKAAAVKEAQTAAVEAKGLEPLASDASLSAGDAVAVLKRGPFFARRAKVEALLNKGVVLVHVDGVATEMGGALKLKRKDLARAPAMPAQKQQASPQRKGRKVPKQLVGLDGTEPSSNNGKAAEKTPQMRTAQNTLDLRGQRYDDAERETDFFLDRMTRSGGPCYILHGHGTGALKTGLRRFLKADSRVKSASPASHDDGGDAFTRVELRRS
jgi:DNA mismatch repair protein MutS2